MDLEIVGGKSTDISKHPWQVSLQENGSPSGGGILIDSQWVLTAAHCVESSYVKKNLAVRVGSTYSNSGGELIKPDKIIVHPGWNFQKTGQYDNDIALIKLASPVTIRTAHTIPLPSASLNILSGSDISVTGWGATDERNGTLPTVLQEVTVPYVQQEVCEKLYSHLTSKISKNMLCAGFVGIGKKDSCGGDSGGPAVYNNQVVGIVSWGLGCAQPDHPGVYTRVTEYLDWIRSNKK